MDTARAAMDPAVAAAVNAMARTAVGTMPFVPPPGGGVENRNAVLKVAKLLHKKWPGIRPAVLFAVAAAVVHTYERVREVDSRGAAIDLLQRGIEQRANHQPTPGRNVMVSLLSATFWAPQINGQNAIPLIRDFMAYVRVCMMPTRLTRRNVTADTARVAATRKAPAARVPSMQPPTASTVAQRFLSRPRNKNRRTSKVSPQSAGVAGNARRNARVGRAIVDLKPGDDFSTRIFKTRFSFTEKRRLQRKKNLKIQVQK